jgi:mannobiose 2-epimerase
MPRLLRLQAPDPPYVLRMPRPEAIEAVLRRHVLEPWFPRCLDPEGGFLCDFDRRWQPAGPQDKLLEFQARQTLTAADACRRYPAEPRYREAALHGFRYLRDVMWDPAEGGWYHRLDRAGRPLEQQSKHAHGIAYAIEACAAVHVATGDAGALRLAQQGFEWLDRCARDPEFGGYFGFLTRAGEVIRTPGQIGWPTSTDTIGTEIGLKDANVHSDLLETLVELYRVWPDARVGDRLAEVLELVSAKLLVAGSGALHIYVTADWRPIPHLMRAGYQFQTAYRLTLARALQGGPETLVQRACQLADCAIRHTRDRRAGGFCFAAPATPPTALQGHDLTVAAKSWWVQAEALKGLLAVSRFAPEPAPYRDEFAAQWEYLNRACLDPAFGGFYATSGGPLPRWRRALGSRGLPAEWTAKGNAWKDASHDGRALLYCLEVLEGPGAPG